MIRKKNIFTQILIQTIKMYQASQEQTYFADQLDQVHQIYIKTSYGNIFAHCVGQPGQPLIIVVHGSGPRNSGDQYLYMLHEYLVRISYVEKFFVVAIDCPGYGRSKGSKEAVKTFPLQMFREILRDLGYNSYFAMLGHSQGGAAIFNAVYEDPKLTEFLLMDRPVCGNIKRFAKFPIPTLLVYDIQDDGHPIWQGKLLFKELLASEFYTYRASQSPYWVPDNIWNLIINFFKKYSTQRKTLMSSNFSRGLLTHRSLSTKNRQNKSHSNQKREKNQSKTKSKQPKKKSVSTSKYDKIKKQRQSSEKSLVQISQIERSELYSKAGDLEEMEDLPTWLNQPKQEQTEQEMREEEEMKKKAVEKLQKQIKIEDLDTEGVKKQKRPTKQPQSLPKQQSPQKFQTKKQSKQQNSQQIPTQPDDKCSICHQNYYHPVQTNCKHVFCKKCLGQSILVDERCPLCRTKITKKIVRPELHEQIVGKMEEKQRQRRQKDLAQFEQMLKSIVYIEIGNSSRELATKQSSFTKTKKKYTWQVYAKEPKNFKFEQVSFNINMGNRDSVPIKVTHAPFVFESRSTFSFTCEITIKPKNRDYATIVSVYRIDVEPGNHSKIIAVRKKKV